MTTPERHQLKIAKSTLKLTDFGATILGGMTKAEAREFLADKVDWSASRITKYENQVSFQ